MADFRRDRFVCSPYPYRKGAGHEIYNESKVVVEEYFEAQSYYCSKLCAIKNNF